MTFLGLTKSPIGYRVVGMSKVITTNKKAFFSYNIESTFEAGIVLQGTEVKSIRQGKVNLKDSYAVVKNEEVFLQNCHISPYSHGTHSNHDPLRLRKLLLHKQEIQKLIGKTKVSGMSLIPLKLYMNNRGIVKLEMGLGKGKKLHDKRQSIKERDARREISRAVKNNY